MGWLDPGYFVYSDETDFCKRLGDAGWRILYVPSARAVHHEGAAWARLHVEGDGQLGGVTPPAPHHHRQPVKP